MVADGLDALAVCLQYIENQGVRLTTDQILVIASLVVAVLAIVIGALAARRWGSRRGRVLFEWETITLLPIQTSNHGLLKVTYRDIEVQDPYLVTARIRNVGPNDIASECFDANRPSLVKLNCKMFGVITLSHPDATLFPTIGDDAIIQMRPLLLRRGEEWRIEVIVGGEPTPQLITTLVDIDIIDGQSYREKIARSFAATILEAASPIGPGLVRGLLR